MQIITLGISCIRIYSVYVYHAAYVYVYRVCSLLSM